jgi:hypothetical protein
VYKTSSTWFVPPELGGIMHNSVFHREVNSADLCRTCRFHVSPDELLLFIGGIMQNVGTIPVAAFDAVLLALFTFAANLKLIVFVCAAPRHTVSPPATTNNSKKHFPSNTSPMSLHI